MQWISVEDKEPPKDGTPFLCYDPNISDSFPCAKIYVVQWVGPCIYNEGGFREAGGECYFRWEPTHWMPLPNPPDYPYAF